MRKILSIAAIMILSINFITIASGDFPPAPHRFRGYVIDENGELADNDTIVSANLNGRYYNTTVRNGKYGYPLLTEYFYINGSAGEEGDIIYFYIDGQQTDQTANFYQMMLNVNNSLNFNLSLDSSSLQISDVSSSVISSSEVSISWKTNKPADSIVNFGTNDSLSLSKSVSDFVTNHQINLDKLNSDTKYYFEVVSKDYSSNSKTDDNNGDYYSFTTSKESNGNGGPGGNGPVIPSDGSQENILPVADANGPYYGMINTTILFDSSNSSDSDGYIIEYSWNFGDGTNINTTNTKIEHVYLEIGNYSVTLTVKDNDNGINSSITWAYINDYDSDDDGWSDEAEILYDTDPNNSSDFPVDSDKDFIPDSIDDDDDNDGLTDEEENFVHTNSTNPDDVLRILNNFGLFYLLDINKDGVFDKFYNQSGKFITNLKEINENDSLIDVNNDSIYEFIFYFDSQTITYYLPPESDKVKDNINYLLILVIVVLVLVILVFYLFTKKGRKNK